MTGISIKQIIGRKITVWPIEDVAYFQASQKYVMAFHVDGGSLLIGATLCSLEREYSDLFIRTHKGVLVAKRLIDGVHQNPFNSSGYVELKGVPDPVPCSRNTLSSIRSFLKSA